MDFIEDIPDANDCGNGITKMHHETMQELIKRRLKLININNICMFILANPPEALFD